MSETPNEPKGAKPRTVVFDDCEEPRPADPQLLEAVRQATAQARLHQATEDLRLARLTLAAYPDLPEAQAAVQRLERRVALLTARQPVTHDLTRTGEPITLEVTDDIARSAEQQEHTNRQS